MVADPARTATLVQALHSLMLPLQAAPGLIASALYIESNNPDAICYVEEWQSREEMDQQLRSDHYGRLLSIMEAAAQPPQIRFSWVTDVKGLEYLGSVRLCGNG